MDGEEDNMKIYSDSEAQEHLEAVLSKARKEGAVGIRQQDGQMFIVRPENVPDSPLNVEGVKLPISTDEIVGFIHEARKE